MAWQEGSETPVLAGVQQLGSAGATDARRHLVSRQKEVH